jgi:hypothetical protein
MNVNDYKGLNSVVWTCFTSDFGRIQENKTKKHDIKIFQQPKRIKEEQN